MEAHAKRDLSFFASLGFSLARFATHAHAMHGSTAAWLSRFVDNAKKKPIGRAPKRPRRVRLELLSFSAKGVRGAGDRGYRQATKAVGSAGTAVRGACRVSEQELARYQSVSQ